MSEQLLGLLRFGLLGLLYLFFGRVLWAVWSEVRSPRVAATAAHAPTTAADRPGAPEPRAVKNAGVGRLVLLEPRARKGESFVLDREILAGRTEACAIALADDTFVSQLHAKFHVEGGRAWVEDLGSTNGTYLNGRRLTAPHALSAGDRVSIGGAVLEAR